jgi:hypothetical protein
MPLRRKSRKSAVSLHCKRVTVVDAGRRLEHVGRI